MEAFKLNGLPKRNKQRKYFYKKKRGSIKQTKTIRDRFVIVSRKRRREEERKEKIVKKIRNCVISSSKL